MRGLRFADENAVTLKRCNRLLPRDRDLNYRTAGDLARGRAAANRDCYGVACKGAGQNQIDLLHAGNSGRGTGVVGLSDRLTADGSRDHPCEGKSGGEDLDDTGGRGGMRGAVDAVVLIQNSVRENSGRECGERDGLRRAREAVRHYYHLRFRLSLKRCGNEQVDLSRVAEDDLGGCGIESDG